MITVIEKQYMDAVIRLSRKLAGPRETDWEQRRWELVCSITQGLLAGGHSWEPGDPVKLAGSIIAEYRGEAGGDGVPAAAI